LLLFFLCFSKLLVLPQKHYHKNNLKYHRVGLNLINKFHTLKKIFDNKKLYRRTSANTWQPLRIAQAQCLALARWCVGGGIWGVIKPPCRTGAGSAHFMSAWQ